MRIRILSILLFISTALWVGGELLPSQSNLNGAGEIEFREIGSFQVEQSLLEKMGKTTEIKKGSLVLRVFTDEIDIRISPEGHDENFLAFQIYFSGDIVDASGENLIPGVQAYSDQGEVVRHLVLTAQFLKIVKFPTSSSDVETTYATRYER